MENSVIKPFLKKLGYTEDDYTQQLRLNVGNHNGLLIPDFVLLPNQNGRNITAFAIIEAKRSITNEKDLNAALDQARSYAKQLGTRYSAVASQEKIWITSIDSDYTEIKQEWTWGELGNLDDFMNVRLLLERR
ncbi:MAG: type I restriction enzyme HsdR N-terminal domain-containing protein [Lachnospiraceae bacterium]|nr:type I restriction enzyme HsdR N-terminal domain-containing protein [Lachnospiraceae bacterium]